MIFAKINISNFNFILFLAVFISCQIGCNGDDSNNGYEQIINETLPCSGATFSFCGSIFNIDLDLDGEEDVEFEIRSNSPGAAAYLHETGKIKFLNSEWSIMVRDSLDYFCTDTTDYGDGFFQYVHTNCNESDNYSISETNQYPIVLTEENLDNYNSNLFSDDVITFYTIFNDQEPGPGTRNRFILGIKPMIEEEVYFVFKKSTGSDFNLYGLKLKSGSSSMTYIKVVGI